MNSAQRPPVKVARNLDSQSISKDQKKGQNTGQKMSSASKFMSLLQKNRTNDVQRKQMIEQNHIKRTKSTASTKLPQIMALNRPGSNEKQEASHSSFRRSMCLQKTSLEVPNESKLQLQLNFKKIKDKFKLNSKRSYLKQTHIIPNPQTARVDSSKLVLLTSKNVQGRNFCDMFASLNPRTTKEADTNRKESKEEKVVFIKNSLDQIPNTSSASIRKPNTLQVRKVASCQHLYSPNYAVEDFPKRKCISFAPPRNSKIQERQTRRFSEKIKVVDSAFLNQFFKVKKELFNSKITAILNRSQVENEMDTLVKKNYRSYWMMAIDEILAEDAIDVIQHGYYRYKQIGMGPFRLMSLIEQIKYRVGQDIIRERFLLFNSRKRKPGAQ